MADSVSIRVPATSANLGPGYDCLGVALQIYNTVTLTRTDDPAQDFTAGGGMMAAAAQRYYEARDVAAREQGMLVTGRRAQCRISITGDVPRSRGMGSSVTVRLGIIQGLNVLVGGGLLTAQQVFALCSELEGHPDNAAPGAFGGFTVAGGVEVPRFEVTPELKFVLLIPDFEVATPDARKVLPAQLERLSAVQSCANTARITAAFATQRYRQLRGAFADGLHQPFRQQLIPFLPEVIAAGEKAGALGGFLSGSGSTICCVTLEQPEAVADAMLQAAKRAGCTGARVVSTVADNAGMQTV